MSEGPSGGQILIGIFLILFGLCFTLLGGGCTIMWVFFIANGETSGAFLFLVSLAVLAGGLVTIWAGVKMFRSNDGPSPPPPPVSPPPPPPAA